MRPIRLRWPWALMTAAYCAGIFALSHSPTPPEAAQPWLEIPGGDKVAHALLYAGLSAVVSVGLRRSNPPGRLSPRQQFMWPVCFAALYGVTDEVHQYFVPERLFEAADLLADIAGALAAQAVLSGAVWRSGTREP